MVSYDALRTINCHRSSACTRRTQKSHASKASWYAAAEGLDCSTAEQGGFSDCLALWGELQKIAQRDSQQYICCPTPSVSAARAWLESACLRSHGECQPLPPAVHHQSLGVSEVVQDRESAISRGIICWTQASKSA